MNTYKFTLTAGGRYIWVCEASYCNLIARLTRCKIPFRYDPNNGVTFAMEISEAVRLTADLDIELICLGED